MFTATNRMSTGRKEGQCTNLMAITLIALMLIRGGYGDVGKEKVSDASKHDAVARPCSGHVGTTTVVVECIRGDRWDLKGTSDRGRVEFTVVGSEKQQLHFALFKHITLSSSLDADYSDEHASLVFGEIVVMLEESNDRVRVKSLLSDNKGWTYRHMLTPNASIVEYLRQEHLFPIYLRASGEEQQYVALTDVPAVRDEKGGSQMNWRRKGFCFIVSEDRLDAFRDTEMGKACRELKPDVLFVYDGERFRDIVAEAARHSYGDLLEKVVQRVTNRTHDIWFVRVNGKAIYHSPSPTRKRNEEPVKDVRLGDPVEVLVRHYAEREVMVKCVSSGAEGWISSYRLTPNEFEIDYIQARDLSPRTGVIRLAGSQIVLGGTVMTISDGAFTPVKENDGFMMVFDGAQDRQEKFCRDIGVSFNPSTFACYVYDGKRFVEVLPAALSQFRQQE